LNQEGLEGTVGGVLGRCLWLWGPRPAMESEKRRDLHKKVLLGSLEHIPLKVEYKERKKGGFRCEGKRGMRSFGAGGQFNFGHNYSLGFKKGEEVLGIKWRDLQRAKSQEDNVTSSVLRE